jgi:hypothetical protein
MGNRVELNSFGSGSGHVDSLLWTRRQDFRFQKCWQCHDQLSNQCVTELCIRQISWPECKTYKKSFGIY